MQHHSIASLENSTHLKIYEDDEFTFSSVKNVKFVLPHKIHIHCLIINNYIIDKINNFYKEVLGGTFILYHVNIMTKYAVTDTNQNGIDKSES